MATSRGPGRPRSTSWIGKLGKFVNDFTPARLAAELDLDELHVYRYARGDYLPSIRRAVAIVYVARSAGVDLSLEDIYAREFDRVRTRIQSSLPPL